MDKTAANARVRLEHMVALIQDSGILSNGVVNMQEMMWYDLIGDLNGTLDSFLPLDTWSEYPEMQSNRQFMLAYRTMEHASVLLKNNSGYIGGNSPHVIIQRDVWRQSIIELECTLCILKKLKRK